MLVLFLYGRTLLKNVSLELMASNLLCCLNLKSGSYRTMDRHNDITRFMFIVYSFSSCSSMNIMQIKWGVNEEIKKIQLYIIGWLLMKAL